MKLENLRVNNIETPLGFQITPMSFSWTVTEPGDSKRQKSAHIQILKEDGKTVYDSGEDETADSLDYRADTALEPRTRYQWKVSVTADNGERAEAQSWFETGKMEEEWEGKWISPKPESGELPSAILYKKFVCGGEIRRSRLYICGLGVYECYINGKKAGNEYLAPGYHSYDFHLQAQTYDVTELLREGENEIEIWLGDGWFKGRLGFDGGYTNLYGDRLYAVAELRTDTAHKEEIVGTGADWSCRSCPVTFGNIYDGEHYDACLENEEKTIPVEEKAPERCGALTDRYSLPVVKKESFQPVEVIHTPKGETVLDFGQNLTGWVEFDSSLEAGSEIRLTASEIMQDGCFYHENLRTAKTEFIYRSNGEKAHVRPHFTFYGFRYMKVECEDMEQVSGFSACHLRSDFEQIGTIRAGNEKVNRLFLNALWSQKDNFLDVPTDCPQRDERLGWTGDAQVFSETACYNMYMPAFYRKYLWDMRAEQSILDGAVPNVVPRLKQGMVSEYGSCPWADAGVIIPWNTYLHYGNKTLLAETYPGMKAWIDYERKKEEEEGAPHLIKSGFHFADWLALDNEQPGPFGATDPLYIASAYYYRCTDILAQAAEILGYEEDYKNYKALAGDIKKAIRNTYFDENGSCICETQTGAALAVAFGLTEQEQAEGEKLSGRVAANENHLNTGFVGTTMLCPALTAAGYHRQAVDLLLNEEYPGWLYSVNLGATTIWERWNSVMPDGSMNPEGMNSLNHYSYGSIEAWMYGDVCGIRPKEPGFKRAVIAPHPDERLGYAECELNTAAGFYRSCWKFLKDSSVIYEVEVPFDAEAEFILNGERRVLQAGIYHFTK